MNIRQALGIADKRTKKTCTQDYVPIKDIEDGIIITDDERYVGVMEILPGNYSMKSEGEQQMILSRYASWWRTAPKRIHIKSISHKTGISDYVKEVKEAISKETSPGCIDMAKSHLEFAAMESQFSSVDRKLYLIFEHEQNEFTLRKPEHSVVIEEMKRKRLEIAQEFNSFGNRIVEQDNPSLDTAKFLYDFYNRTFTNIEPFQARFERIERDYGILDDKFGGIPLELDVKDLICPKSIDSTNANYLLINGIYFTHLYVRTNGYPIEVSPDGFISTLINFGEGYDVDLFFEKKDPSEALQKLNIAKIFSETEANEKTEDARDYEDNLMRLDAYSYIRAALKQRNEDLFDMGLIVTIHAYNLEDLLYRKERLLSYAARAGIAFESCTNFEEEAFLSTVPINKISPKLMSVTKNNITTSDVACTYPFTSFALRDKGGVMLGTNMDNGSMAIYNNFDAKYSNSNLSIYGASGRGKTFALLTLTSRFRLLGVQNFIIAPDKQDEFRRICTQLDGEFIDISQSSNQRINPFDIWPIESLDDTVLYGKTGNENSWLTEKISNLEIWAKHIYPKMELRDSALFKKALIRMYAEKGITEDNNSLYTDATKTVKKEMPIFSDLLEALNQEPLINPDIPIIFDQFVSGDLKKMNGQTNVDLNNKYIVFGIEHLKGHMQAPMMFLVLEFIWSMARANKTQRKMIAIDEGWKMIDGRHPQVGDFVVEIFKVIRGYGGGAIFATQSIGDLFKADENFGNAIIACSHSNIILGMEPKDLEMIKKELDLSANESRDIVTYENGQALLCAGQTRIPLLVKASAREKELFTTRRTDLAKQVEEITKREKEC